MLDGLGNGLGGVLGGDFWVAWGLILCSSVRMVLCMLLEEWSSGDLRVECVVTIPLTPPHDVPVFVAV